MLIERNKFRILLAGLIICLSIGAGFLYPQKRDNNQSSFMPEMDLPNGEEFINLLHETKLYWTSKMQVAMHTPKPLPKSNPNVEEKPQLRLEPILVIEEFNDLENLKHSKPDPEILASLVKPKLPEINDREVVEATTVRKSRAQTSKTEFRYHIEDEILNIEGVLVPQKMTVISSSRDGKIKEIYVDNGDLFQKGDILLAYDCDDLNAEIVVMQAAEKLAKQKVKKAKELFKLDIISALEQRELKVERDKAVAQKKAIQMELEACVIRATYDGRVTNRLANAHEYTRTDRVLMEIASREVLEVDFIVPSKWLRYLNVGAPLTITIAETGGTYSAQINRIHGEVDPVSQSIQMSAQLNAYEDPLLPGMSGLVEINAVQVRSSGVRGFLEEQASDYKRSRLQSMKKQRSLEAGNG